MTRFRIYEPDECGEDGYPYAWHGKERLPSDPGLIVLAKRPPAIKDLMREQAGNRCVRCGHPYVKGMGEWSPCDEGCRHAGPIRWTTAAVPDLWLHVEENYETPGWPQGSLVQTTLAAAGREFVQARWRILTVHHLNGIKADCRWWNLASLCQRCHLRIQRTVVMPRVFPWEHSEWFKPYAAGWYAYAYLGEDITREEAIARQDALLSLERLA